MIYFDLDDIDAIADVETSATFELSPHSHAVIMSLLSHATDRWRWHKSGEALTDAEWDDTEEMVSLAISELLTEV